MLLSGFDRTWVVIRVFLCVLCHFKNTPVTYMMWLIQVIIWWPDLMIGVVSVALAYDKVKYCV